MFNKTTIKDKRLQKQSLKNKAKRFSPARKAVAVTLTILGMSMLYPQPPMAFAAQQNAPSTAVWQQTTYSQAQNERGAQRINKLIQSLESPFLEDGATLKTEELSKSQLFIAQALRNLDHKTLGKYADGIEIYPLSTKEYSLLIANGEVISCKTPHQDITKQLKNGEQNVLDELKLFDGSAVNEGLPKNPEQMKEKQFFYNYLSDYLLSPQDLNTLFNQTTFTGDSVEQALEKVQTVLHKNEESYAKLDRNIHFLSTVVNEECKVGTNFTTLEVLLMINDTLSVVAMRKENNEWQDTTKSMQELLDKNAANRYPSLVNRENDPMKYLNVYDRRASSAKILENADPALVSTFNKNDNIVPIDTGKFNLLTANAQIVQGTKDGVDVTAKIVNGNINVKKKMEDLLSSKTKTGELKDSRQADLDYYVMSILLENLFAEWDVKDSEALNAEIGSSRHWVDRHSVLLERKEYEERIDRKLEFLMEASKANFDVKGYFKDDLVLIIINDTFCLQSLQLENSRWQDTTLIMQQALDATHAEKALKIQKTAENQIEF